MQGCKSNSIVAKRNTIVAKQDLTQLFFLYSAGFMPKYCLKDFAK